MSEQPKWPDDARPLLRLVCEDDASESPEEEAPLAIGRAALSPRMTLCQFAESYVLPVWCAERNDADATLTSYRESLTHWKRFTKDPPLVQIDDWSTGAFVAGLYTLPGRKEPAMSPATVKKHIRQIQTCLDLAGPRTPKHRKAQRLLDEVPWLEKPSVELDTNEDSFTLEELGQILGAAHKMPRPVWPGVTPEAWWQSLVILGYNTGERRGALLGVEYTTLRDRVLLFPRPIRKGKKKSKAVTLNDAALQAIESIRTDRQRIFPWPRWPKSHRWFHTNWEKLLTLAGIPEERQFGLHGMRKCAATEAANINPLAAQLLLGHSDFKTTQEHYVHPKLLAETLAKLPQPKPPGSKRHAPDPRQMRLFE